MMKKLKQQSGETLVESLVSLLVAVLSIALVASSILVSAHLNAKTKEADEKYNKELQIAEGHMEEEGYASTEVEVTLAFASGDKATVHVTLYGGENSDFSSYDYIKEVEKP